MSVEGVERINPILWKAVSSSVLGKQTHVPSTHSINNQDFGERLEYAVIVAWWREVLVIGGQEPVSESSCNRVPAGQLLQ